MTMNTEELKSNFEEQLATTDKQIAELQANLAKAQEYRLKLQGGIETLQLLNGETPGESAEKEVTDEKTSEE